MDIALAFDDGYAAHARVVVESVLRCHSGRDDLTFWILTTATVAQRRAEPLRRQVADRAGLRLLTCGDDFRSLPLAERDGGRLSAGMYLRLYLPHLLPDALERVLYLDCDVLVDGDLTPLWSVPLGPAPVAAVRDGFTRSIGDRGGVPGLTPAMDARAPYFNSGVLLMQPAVWRGMDVTGQVLGHVHEHREHLRHPDQDALNFVLYGRWRPLPSIWNDTFIWWQDPALQRLLEPERVRITHFIGPRKPWHDDFPYEPYRSRYRRLAARIPD
ncbi:glycosyltransferase family 8 protein [Dactylosporangium sp. CA-139066]|uniref:glycosyltransferase family 8 protein n=1 Tax=Dactylosporangium sp. CA-139066 TaxID=3239930 RepID=UPI003D8ACC56